MQARVTRITASVELTIVASATLSMRTSPAPCRTVARIVTSNIAQSTISHLHRVARFFVEPLRMSEYVPTINLLRPRVGADLFHGDRDRFIAIAQDARHILDDRVGEFVLLLLGFSRPEFYDHMGHDCLLEFNACA